MALSLRIDSKMVGDVRVGRIAYPRETGLAKASTVVGAWPRTRNVAYYDDVMLTNRDGACEDYGLTRTYEGEFRGASETAWTLWRYREKQDKRKTGRYRSLDDSLPSRTVGQSRKATSWTSGPKPVFQAKDRRAWLVPL